MRLEPDEPEQLELPFDPPRQPVVPVVEDETDTVIEDDDDDDEFEDDEEDDEEDLPVVEEPLDEPKAN